MILLNKRGQSPKAKMNYSENKATGQKAKKCDLLECPSLEAASKWLDACVDRNDCNDRNDRRTMLTPALY